MNEGHIDQIDELYTVSRAMEAAAQAAANMALQAGASRAKIAQVLTETRERVVQEAADLANPLTDLGKAQRHLLGRRLICRSLNALAIEHGVDHEEITEHLGEVSELSTQIYRAETLSDLGFSS